MSISGQKIHGQKKPWKNPDKMRNTKMLWKCETYIEVEAYVEVANHQALRGGPERDNTIPTMAAQDIPLAKNGKMNTLDDSLSWTTGDDEVSIAQISRIFCGTRRPSGSDLTARSVGKSCKFMPVRLDNRTGSLNWASMKEK